MPHIKKLLEGFKAFRQDNYEDHDIMPRLVADGAHPDIFMIACIDPRSGPSSIFKAEPGAMFGDRVMAALVPPYNPNDPLSEIGASLTYAVDFKKVKDIIIMGHTECGGIEALVTHLDNKDISGWMGTAKMALERAANVVGDKDTKELCRETERQAVIMGMRNLMTYPSVQKAVKSGNLRIKGWMFDMKEGQILEYDLDKKSFEPLISLPKAHQHNAKKKHAP